MKRVEMEEQGEKGKMEEEMKEEKDRGRGEIWRRWIVGGGGNRCTVEGWERERGVRNRDQRK